MLIGRYTDYRDFLKDSLELRSQKNSKYSLRAFARDLDMSPQVLSAVFNKKKGISVEVAAKIAARLNLNENESRYLCDLVDLTHARSAGSRKIAALRLTQYKQALKFQTIKTDALHVLTDWYHFAILELTYVKGFKSEANWIAKRLNITNYQAKQAIGRLLRLGLLSEKNGCLVKTDQHLATTHDVPSEAIRNFNRQILSKAADSLTFQDVGERDLTTMTMAIDTRKIPEAKKRIRDFRRELTEFLESGEREEVYCLSLQLFKLSQSFNEGTQNE